MKNIKNKAPLRAAILIAASVLGLAPLCSFADVLTFSGGICKTYDPAKAGQLYTHHSGAFNNSTTTSVVVTCPLTRDYNTDLNGANVYVKAYRDPSATVVFSCTLLSYDINGVLLASNTAQTSATGVVALSLNVSTSGSNGYYAVACTLPQKSVLRGLVLTE